MLKGGTPANLLTIYEDDGNIYQYGNEPAHQGSSTPCGKFQPKPPSDVFTPGDAVQTESGPLRWRVEAEVAGPVGMTYRIVYTLLASESLVRISVSGGAPPNPAAGLPPNTTVVTTFPAIAADGVTPGTHLIYGTAHHYHEDAVTAYWQPPLFKATHNFLMPAGPGATFPLAAIYHDGMPAWACHDGVLIGSLFRNTDGDQRAAFGTDGDIHSQRYALRISATALDPAQGTPLVESLQVTNPLRAALASPGVRTAWPTTLPSSTSLASATSPALVRVARPMGRVKSAEGPPIQARVALRIYRPDANGTPTSVQVSMPILQLASGVTAALVTALEDPIANAPDVAVNGDTLVVLAGFAVTTAAVTATRPGSAAASS